MIRRSTARETARSRSVTAVLAALIATSLFAATPAQAHPDSDDIAWADTGKYMCSNDAHKGACVYAKAYGDHIRLCDEHGDGRYAFVRVGRKTRPWSYKLTTRGWSVGTCFERSVNSGHNLPEGNIRIKVCRGYAGNLSGCAIDYF